MDIKYLVEFMYKGEINVEHVSVLSPFLRRHETYELSTLASQQNNLASLLKTAEELRIKGLAEVSWRDDESDNAESNDNNNNVTDATNNFPLLSQTPIPSNSNHITGASSGGDRKGYDNKENLLKAIPFLAPLSSPKDLSSSSRKKRGRPPLDESNHFTRA